MFNKRKSKKGKRSLGLLFAVAVILLLAVSIVGEQKSDDSVTNKDDTPSFNEEQSAEPSSATKELGHRYSTDEYAVYYNDKKIEGADPETFELISSEVWGYYDAIELAKDKYNVYINSKPWDEVDPESFEVLGRRYYKDKFNIYFEDKKIEEAEPESFTVPDSGRVHDANLIYVGADPVVKNTGEVEIMGYYGESDEGELYTL